MRTVAVHTFTNPRRHPNSFTRPDPARTAARKGAGGIMYKVSTPAELVAFGTAKEKAYIALVSQQQLVR